MTQKILVTYATRTGATVGVAEAIGNTLVEHGAQVDVLSMQAVNDLSAYGAVVAGSGIQSNAWLPEAMQFVRMHRAALSQRPTAIFTVCMTLAMRDGEKFRPQVSAWLAPVRALVLPVSEGIFAGVLDIGKIPSLGDRMKFRLSVMSGVWSEGDHRDWHAIQKWAGELYPKLQRA